MISKRGKHMKLKKIFLFIITLFSIPILVSCNEVQSEYHEVYVIVVENNTFYFVNPSDGKDTISIKNLENEQPQFVYLYEPIEGVEFSYEHFFSNIQTQYIKTDRRNNKHYILSTKDIDTWIYQYHIDKEAWESNQP